MEVGFLLMILQEHVILQFFTILIYQENLIIKKFPRLEKFLDDIASLSSIESYLSKRPELIDVSIEPKLVINGKAHPTGTVKTISNGTILLTFNSRI